MYCPNCGANNSTEQRFCRSCGMNLEKTAESMLEQLPTAESANLLKQTKLLEKIGGFAFSGFISVCLVGLFAFATYILIKFVGSGDLSKIFQGLFFFAFFIFAGLSLIYVILREYFKEKSKKINPTMQNQVEKPDTAKLLEDKPFEPIPRVTEHSTELLFVENSTKKFE